MALAQLKWFLEINIADNSGDISPRFYEMPVASAADFDAFTVLGNALRAALLNMTDGVIASYRIGAVFVEASLTLPASGVENENQAFFSGKIVGDPTDSATQSIPAAKPAIFTATVGPGANVVDMSDGAVLTWVGFFDQAGPGPWTVSDGEYWTSTTVKGKRRHVKRSNG